MKKWMSSTLLMLLVLVLVSGCATSNGNNEGSKSSTGKGSTGQSSSEKKDSDEKITLKVYTWYNLENEKFDLIKSEFEKAHPNIMIEYVSAGDNNSLEHLKKVDLAAASNESMDVIMFSNSAQYAQRLAQGLLEPLDEYMAAEGINFADEYSVDTQADGKYYGLPGKSVSFFVLINEEHLKKANLPLPTEWTWDEFLDYAKAMTNISNEKKNYGTYFHTWQNPYLMLTNLNQLKDAYLVTDDHKSANVDTDVMRKALEIRLQAEADGSATPYAEVISQKMNYRPQYFNQDASMIITGSFMLPEVGGTDKVPATFKTVFAPLPKLSKEEPNRAEVASDIVTVYSKSKNKEAAYTFARWFTTEGLIVQGRNIPSWKKANMENVVDTIINATNNPEMIDKASALQYFTTTEMLSRPLPVPYTTEVETAIQDEFDLMMLKGQSIDETIAKAQEKVQKIVDQNQ